MISRAHRSPFSDWWWTVDRGMLSLALLLLLSGLVFSFAASLFRRAKFAIGWNWNPWARENRYTTPSGPVMSGCGSTSLCAARWRAVASIVVKSASALGPS